MSLPSVSEVRRRINNIQNNNDLPFPPTVKPHAAEHFFKFVYALDLRVGEACGLSYPSEVANQTGLYIQARKEVFKPNIKKHAQVLALHGFTEVGRAYTLEEVMKKYNGEEVWSRLGGDLLRKIVYATDGGQFLPVEPGTTLDLGRIYESLIASAEKRELESTTMFKYDEKFQIFLALGLLFLICEAFISERRKV